MKKSISVLLLTAMLVSMLALPGGALADKPRLTVAGEADQAMPEGYGTVEENQWVDWIRENGPADIEVIAISEDNDLERYSMLMASGTAPDIIYSGDPVTMNTLINQRLLMPLDDVIEKYSVEYKARLEKYPFLRDLGSVDGKLYLLGAPSAAERRGRHLRHQPERQGQRHDRLDVRRCPLVYPRRKNGHGPCPQHAGQHV